MIQQGSGVGQAESKGKGSTNRTLIYNYITIKQSFIISISGSLVVK